MNVIKDNRKHSGWIEAVIDGRWVEAKVYDDPSNYGINEGRVSKIAIGKTAERIPGQNFFDQMAFNYDRGHDFDDLPAGALDSIVSQLEALPKAHT